MRAVLYAASLIGVAGLPGCVVVQTGVTNPVPEMTTVAIAPFVNLSAERSVDGRRFALAYHAELQKIPGYQVIPVGVTERALIDLGLDLDGPDDALQLAQALGADAVVIGAVTDYNPYYPPRIGLQVSWYASEPCRFVPGIPTDPGLGDAVKAWRFADNRRLPPLIDGVIRPAATIVRAQSPDPSAEAGAVVHADAVESRNPIRLLGIEIPLPGDGPLLFPPFARRDETPPVHPVAAEQVARERSTADQTATEMIADETTADEKTGKDSVGEDSVTDLAATSPGIIAVGQDSAPPVPSPLSSPDHLASPEVYSIEACPPAGSLDDFALHSSDPRQPIMSYTRLFDGSDAELTALLRDYVLLSGDLRSGGWEAYLHRSEDFIRFTAHRMIVEMLTLHGGESKRRYVWLLNRDRH